MYSSQLTSEPQVRLPGQVGAVIEVVLLGAHDGVLCYRVRQADQGERPRGWPDRADLRGAPELLAVGRNTSTQDAP